ncbi:Sigma-70, region 4 [compost metagenome]
MTSLLSSFQNLFHHAPVDQGSAPLAARLNKLPRRVQQVLLLSRLDDLAFAEIAHHLDIPLSTVENHMALSLQVTAQSAEEPLSMIASHWYSRLQNPLTTASERIDFRRWLDACPSHRDAFHATELHWRRLLVPARQLGAGHWYRQPLRTRLSWSGYWLAALALGALTVLYLWA